VLTWTFGLFALVYGFSNAETHGWGATATIVALVLSPMLLTAFVLIQRGVAHPLMPLHIVWERARGGSFAALLVTGAGIFAVFLFLTYFMQENLGFSPLKTGLAFLPLSAVLVTTSTTVQTRVIQHTGVKPLVLLGMALGVVGMLLFTQLSTSSSYGTGVLPGLLVIGVGMGCIFAPTFSAATLGVAPNESGIASAMVNTSQQVGGSIGTSLLSTIYASAVAGYVATHLHRGLASAAQVHGDTTAFWWATGIFGLGFLLTLLIMPSRCEARTATTLTAMARHAIGNCDHAETDQGAAAADSPGPPEPALAP
jgi:Major Facilitator Superfamily